jgi:hypothetical protein
MTRDEAAIAAYLARGGRITRCPAAYVAETLHAAPPDAATAAAHRERGLDPAPSSTSQRRKQGAEAERKRALASANGSAAKRARS